MASTPPPVSTPAATVLAGLGLPCPTTISPMPTVATENSMLSRVIHRS